MGSPPPHSSSDTDRSRDDDVSPGTDPDNASPERPGVGAELSLAETLRRARRMVGMSLRAVEAATGSAVTNGYLSQIENDTVAQPSPNVLYHLSGVYGLDYGDLLVRAGHRLPRDQVPPEARAVEGFPLRALADLTPDERKELADYIEFLRYRRASGGSGGRPPGGPL